MVGHDAVQEASSSGTRDFVLGEVGDLQEADTSAHGPALLSDGSKCVGPAEGGDLDLSGSLRGKPEGVLQAEGCAPHRSLGVQGVVRRRSPPFPGRRQLLVGVGEHEASPVVLLGLQEGVIPGGEASEPAHVHGVHVHLRLTVNDPLGQAQADTAGLAEPGHHRAGHPVVVDTGDRADEWVAVRGEGEWAINDPGDAGGGKGGHSLLGNLDPVGEPLQVGSQQAHPEVQGCGVDGPGFSGVFIGSHQQTVALLPGVDATLVVNGHRQLAVVVDDFLQFLGDHVLVLHGQ